MSLNNIKKRINIKFFKRFISLKKTRSLAFIIFFMLLISSTFQKHLKKVKKNKLNEGSYNGDTIRNLEDKLNNFMVLYYKEDCYYYNGFQNEFRYNISFVINRENNYNLTSEEELIVSPNFGIEIHFNQNLKM